MNCNGAKNDWFPLEPGSPVLAEGQLAAQADPSERPLLIHLGANDLEDHLTFEFDRGTARWRIAPLTDRGQETIARVELDREDLDVLRNDHFSLFIRTGLRLYRGATTHSAP